MKERLLIALAIALAVFAAMYLFAVSGYAVTDAVAGREF